MSTSRRLGFLSLGFALGALIALALCLPAHAGPRWDLDLTTNPHVWLLSMSDSSADRGTIMQPGDLAITPPVESTPLVIHDAGQPVTTLHPDGTVTPAPLSAIAVSQCGLAVALFVQLDATHLLRADPRQSDMFVAVDGKMEQTTVGPIPWDDAYKVAMSAVLTSHVTLPCTEGPSV